MRLRNWRRIYAAQSDLAGHVELAQLDQVVRPVEV
jgi:hypothetical protein